MRTVIGSQPDRNIRNIFREIFRERLLQKMNLLERADLIEMINQSQKRFLLLITAVRIEIIRDFPVGHLRTRNIFQSLMNLAHPFLISSEHFILIAIAFGLSASLTLQ